jgi:hypothetical protein
MKKKLEDHNCTNLQQWKEAILKVWLKDRGVHLPAKPVCPYAYQNAGSHLSGGGMTRY